MSNDKQSAFRRGILKWFLHQCSQVHLGIFFIISKKIIYHCVCVCKIRFMFYFMHTPLCPKKRINEKLPNDCFRNERSLKWCFTWIRMETADKVKAKVLPSGLASGCNFFQNSMSVSFTFSIICCSFPNIPGLHNLAR